jgi:hypothetical protein
MDTNQEPKGGISAAQSNAGNEKPHALEYVRSLFQNIINWYTNADTKASYLLTLAGAFVTFLTASAFGKKDDLKLVLEVFGPETWLLMGVMFVCLVLSIACALMCLKSRGRPKEWTDHVREVNADPSGALRQKAETLWFFGYIADLNNRERFQRRMAEITVADEIAALSYQVFALSKNVARKHCWVNRGFSFIALTLIFFLLAGSSYVCRVNRLPAAAAKVASER